MIASFVSTIVVHYCTKVKLFIYVIFNSHEQFIDKKAIANCAAADCKNKYNPE
tara:strand:- start:5054 stop:5212 length:159 start_codon:yes stop_codon:yes gene_type:complete